MRTLFRQMRTQLEQGRDLVLVTVIAASGATPRGTGARMLVGAQGRICGTIGGGAVEYRAQQVAQDVLEEKSSQGRDFSLTKDDVQNLGMICGGAVTVYFSYIPGSDAAAIALCREVEAGFDRDQDLFLISDIARGGQLTLATRDDPALAPLLPRRPHRVTESGRDWYIEQIHSAGKVYIFGGGHVAQELVPVLAHVGFRCVVLDDRAEFTRPELFPGAQAVIQADLGHVREVVSIGSEDYVCVMTRGHAFDTLVQAQVLPCRPCYCGVIGSKFKAAAVRQVLKETYALEDDLLDLVTTPIGLDIGGETPAEIAISIAAQMILHRARRNEG